MRGRFISVGLSAALTILGLGCVSGDEAAQTNMVATSSVGDLDAVDRHFTVLAGGGHDTISLNASFPSTIRVQTGDTVTWILNSDEVRTISFLGGSALPTIPARSDLVPVPDSDSGAMMLNPWSNLPTRAPAGPVEVYDGTQFISSGVMSKEPVAPGLEPNDSFTVRFDTPGTYEFIDLNHLTVRGTIVVLGSADAEVDDQASIDARASDEMKPLQEFAENMRLATSILGDIRHLSSNYLFTDEFLQALGPYAVENSSGEIIYRESMLDGSDRWLVQAALGPDDSKLLDFIPKELTVRSGDTVSWNFPTAGHTLVFDPVAPPPEFIQPLVGDEWPPLLVVNSEVALPVVPSRDFVPSMYYSSGLTGFPGSPGGKEFTLKFSQIGSFDYFCAVHRELGMEGTIRVIEYDS